MKIKSYKTITAALSLIILLTACSSPTGTEGNETAVPHVALEEGIELIEPGITTPVYITTNSDIDTFKIVLPHDGLIEVKIEDIPLDMLSPSIYGQKIVLYDEEFVSLNSIYPNEPDVSIFRNIKAGTYFISCGNTYNRNASSTPYNLTVDYDREDLTEFNDNFDDADDIVLDSLYSAKILPVNDSDFYRITVDEPQTYYIDVDSISSRYDLGTTIYDTEGTKLLREYSKTDSSNSYYTFDKAGTYYVGFSSYSYQGYATRPFYFKVSKYVNDTTEFNNSFETATPIEINETVESCIFPVYDKDYYSFTLSDSASLDFTFENVSSKLNMYLYLYDSEGTKITSWSVKSYPVGTWKLKAGEYYLLLKDYYTAYSEKNHSFTISKSDK